MNAALEANGRMQYQNSRTSQQTRTLRPFQTEQFKQGEKYCWSISSRNGDAMAGKVWEALEEPRCHVKLTSDSSSSSDCEMHIKVFCKREDIIITQMKLKEKDKRSEEHTSELQSII